MFFRSGMLLYVTFAIATKKYTMKARVKTILIGFTSVT